MSVSLPAAREPEPDGSGSQSPLNGGGEMGALMRSIDWARTAVGPVSGWPQSLRTALSILLETHFPMYIAWGPEYTQFYNDGYRPILGSTKHPAAMGRSSRETFAEIWNIIGPMFEGVMRGTAVGFQDFLLPLDRHGFVEECYFIFSYSPIRDESSGVGGVLVTVTETTERVLGERRLRSLRDLSARTAEVKSAEEACETAVAALADNAADLPFALLYLIDADGRNAHLAGAAGLAPGTAAAPRVVDLAAVARGEADGGLPWPLAQVAAGNAGVHLDDLPSRIGPLPVVNGQPHPTGALVLPVSRPGESRPSGLLVVGLSARLPFDARYRSFLELVSGQIATAIASARALEEAKARADALAEIDRAKTAFFSNVSHELRTPLTLMLGPVEDARLAARPLQGEDLDAVYRNSVRLLKLVNSLLDFSRLEAGRLEASYEAVDLAALTVELASVFRSAIERAGLRLVVDCPPLDEPVFVDREMWERIVLNLMSNAFKFTFAGSIEVALRRRDEPGAAGAGVELAIRDTGTGIAASELPRLFDRFHRVEGARGRTHEGTGIGLALVQELVKLHGGNIQADSAPGQGTTFVVRLPLGNAHLPADRLKARSTPIPTNVGAAPYLEEALRCLPEDEHEDGGGDGGGGGAARPSGAGAASASASSRLPAVHGEAPPAQDAHTGRILIADDNADMREYLRRLLASRYTIETAPDGEAALAAARAHVPDLVLTDVMMPGLDGFGLLRGLRRDPRTRSVPIIFLSARAGEESKVEGLELGADDYLVKPFSARELLARVTTHLELSRLRADADVVNRIGALLTSELDFDKIVQVLTDEATGLVGAQFGAFFYNVTGQQGESYMLYTLSGVSRDAFAGFPMPRKTDIFAPTFDGVGIVRIDDVTRDPRYGKNAPHHGMPAGHLPVRSYLAVPVPSRTGEVIGGLFFGHSEPGMFTERDERLLASIAPQAAIAIDNARLYDSARRAQSETELARLRLRTLLLQAPVAVAVLRGPELTFELANPLYERLVSKRDVVGKTLRSVFPEIEGQEILRLLNRVRETGEAFAARDLPVQLDREGTGVAEEGYYSFSIEPIREADGQVSGIIVVVIETTDRVADRRQLESARAEAESASRSKDEFLAMLGHELRNPLAPIQTALQLMRLRGDDSSLRERTVIERQVTHVVRLVDDLLDVSRITRGNIQLRREPIEIADVIAKAIEMSSPLVEERHHRLTVAVQRKGLPVDGDPMRLGQVISNLITNAAKYTEAGGEIGVSAERRGGEIVVSVRDTGIGLDPAIGERVFDLFVQEQQSLDRSRGGLGIGLTIVKRLVELHGGSVEAHSEGRGHGSRFVVRLPAYEAPAAPGPRVAADVAGAPSRAPRSDARRVLIVDDNVDAADLLSEGLSQLGFVTQVAYDPPSALTAAASFVPDIALLDVGLPVIDGYEVGRRLRAVPALAQIRLVAVTGYGQEGDRARSRAAGFDGHQVKPIDLDALSSLIDRLTRPS
jgi:signal transduction histidine kinase/DNA-binding response OmpR family regulator